MESERKTIAFDPGNLTGIDGVSGVKEHQQGCYHYLRKRRTYGETATNRYSNSVRQPDFYSYQTHQIPQETNPHRKPGKDIRLCLRAVTGQMEPHEENKVIDTLLHNPNSRVHIARHDCPLASGYCPKTPNTALL